MLVVIFWPFVLSPIVDNKNSANFLARKRQVSAPETVLAEASRDCTMLFRPGSGRQAGGLDRSLVSPVFECAPRPRSLSSFPLPGTWPRLQM